MSAVSEHGVDIVWFQGQGQESKSPHSEEEEVVIWHSVECGEFPEDFRK